eukprot:782181-Prymnesium_polylepis.1
MAISSVRHRSAATTQRSDLAVCVLPRGDAQVHLVRLARSRGSYLRRLHQRHLLAAASAAGALLR